MSSKAYLYILNEFRRFLAKQADPEAVSQEMIREWLTDRIQVWRSTRLPIMPDLSTVSWTGW
jgi:hypothetical protein